MEVSAQKESASSKIGKEYRLRIKEADRAKFFKPDWTEVEVEMDGRRYRLPLNDQFWTTCPELRDDKKIGRHLFKSWLQRHRSLTWKLQHPPKAQLVPLGNDVFRLIA